LAKNEREKVQILAVSIDSREDSKKFLQKLKERFAGDLDFPMLEDKNHKVIDRYGIFNPDGKGWPHPATYVIDKQGWCAGALSRSTIEKGTPMSRSWRR